MQVDVVSSFPFFGQYLMLCYTCLYTWTSHHITDPTKVPLMENLCEKSNKQFQPCQRGSSKEMPEKLTSAAATSKCHMLLFRQLCKLRDV